MPADLTEIAEQTVNFETLNNLFDEKFGQQKYEFLEAIEKRSAAAIVPLQQDISALQDHVEKLEDIVTSQTQKLIEIKSDNAKKTDQIQKLKETTDQQNHSVEDLTSTLTEKPDRNEQYSPVAPVCASAV